MKVYEIAPISKPRMVRGDKWKKRPCVMRYRAFADECRLRRLDVPEGGAHITFVMPMPSSWSKKKKSEMNGQPHQQKPDVDNLCKALFDAVHNDDSGIWDCRISKRWGETGKIVIKQMSEEV